VDVVAEIGRLHNRTTTQLGPNPTPVPDNDREERRPEQPAEAA
jgi:hypothetical protein